MDSDNGKPQKWLSTRKKVSGKHPYQNPNPEGQPRKNGKPRRPKPLGTQLRNPLIQGFLNWTSKSTLKIKSGFERKLKCLKALMEVPGNYQNQLH